MPFACVHADYGATARSYCLGSMSGRELERQAHFQWPHYFENVLKPTIPRPCLLLLGWCRARPAAQHRRFCVRRRAPSRGCVRCEEPGDLEVSGLARIMVCVRAQERGRGGSNELLPWQAYLPKKEWLVSLWAQRKLDHDDFERLSAHFREGHAARMQELAAVRRTEMACAVREHIRLEAARADTTTLLSFRRFAEVDQFLTCFEPKTFLLRRPILVIVGATNLGKSMLAADVLRRVGLMLGLSTYKEVTVEGDDALDLSEFNLAVHAGVLLDGVGDALMLHQHREALQGRAKENRGGRSATMMYAYPFTLCRRAVVATMDLSAANLDFFQKHHWLSDRRNVILLQLQQQAWV